MRLIRTIDNAGDPENPHACRILDRLNATINKFLQEPEMKKNLEAQGMAPSGGTAEKFDKRIRGDYERWVKIVRERNIKPE